MAKKPFTPIPPMAELPPAEDINVQEILDKYLAGEIDLICVLGPTASGKTRYAVQLARQINSLLEEIPDQVGDDVSNKVRDDDSNKVGDDDSNKVGDDVSNKVGDDVITGLTGNLTKACAEIISADSRQVYRGMDIGTGKDLGEYEEIPYHLMDITDRGCIPILCGGSGLYIEAATCGYSLPEVPADPGLRAELEKETDEVLIARLAALKPLHNTTDYDTRKRLIRALEIAIYEARHPVNRTSFLPKNTYYIGTLVSRDVRNARIDARLDARLEEGMVEEIRGLLDNVPAEDLIYYGLEYKFVTLYLIGELTYDQMRTQLATAIHQFAKRQMTWFRGMERKGIRIHWTAV